MIDTVDVVQQHPPLELRQAAVYYHSTRARADATIISWAILGCSSS